MTDVRLTATNPDDSSVVPVACNTRGELLIVEPVIAQIDNDVTITGSLQAGTADDAGPSVINGVSFYNKSGGIQYLPDGEDSPHWQLRGDGFAIFDRTNTENMGSVDINGNSKALGVYNAQGTRTWSVGYSGQFRGSQLILQLESDNPANFKTVTYGRQTRSEYIGPELDVLKALVALKNEVQRLEEKLKMTPSAGWEVWDGSA